jgi:hypothetical protein
VSISVVLSLAHIVSFSIIPDKLPLLIVQYEVTPALLWGNGYCYDLLIVSGLVIVTELGTALTYTSYLVQAGITCDLQSKSLVSHLNHYLYTGLLPVVASITLLLLSLALLRLVALALQTLLLTLARVVLHLNRLLALLVIAV